MSAATRLETGLGSWALQRYPRRSKDPLRAWCGADLLLIEAASERQPSQCLVVNDEHGALSTALQPALSWTDSALAALATESNLQSNALAPVPVCWSTSVPALRPELVVLRVPKQTAYFEYQLAVLHALMPAGAELLCAGMDKHLSPHTADTIARVFGPTERHRGSRKARMFSTCRDDASPLATPLPSRYRCDALNAELVAMANVFSATSLDIGSRALIDKLHLLEPVPRVADLACGNGVLGLCARQRGLGEEFHFFDESAMAIASAEENWQSLYPDEAAHFHHGDGLLASTKQFDMILCNPPFHLGHSVDDFAGRRLLQQCKTRLAPGGSLVVVANRHLAYAETLNQHFDQVSVLANDKKFQIWRAVSVA
ncbi:class I SAM-dependent methyltransferase [Halioglobus maricola]|uniref:Class I SAM-dependent methyltransferase n=1 Tax=Halioglobus maricola TaxID=2601894 RepID=A0A5P9NL59_9GAMM|nr:class I SAM-dependent methyltransferase [Halioglobus maricola]QFU75974.1 class I SAM-dependent methyltransferase [Halioglobus maricola]